MAGSGSSEGLSAEMRLARSERVESIQKARINRSTYGLNWSYSWQYSEHYGGITEEQTSLESLKAGGTFLFGMKATSGPHGSVQITMSFWGERNVDLLSHQPIRVCELDAGLPVEARPEIR